MLQGLYCYGSICTLMTKFKKNKRTDTENVLFLFFFYSYLNKHISWKLSEKLFIPYRLLLYNLYYLQDNFLASSDQFESSPISEMPQ